MECGVGYYFGFYSKVYKIEFESKDKLLLIKIQNDSEQA